MVLNENSTGNSVKFQLFYFLSLPLIFYYYFGEYRIYAGICYLGAILVFLMHIFLTERISRLQLYILSSLIFLTIISLFTFSHLIPAFLSLRLYFGIFILTLFYGVIQIPDINKISIFLSLWTLAEYVLIRAFSDIIYLLPNYDETFLLSQTAQVLGGVHSFGGNRTVTAVILLALFTYLEGVQQNRKFRYLPLIACILTASGTAYALFFLYMIIKYATRVFPLMIILLAFGIVSFSQYDDAYLISKFNSEYLIYLWNFKSDQVIDYWSKVSGVYEILFGMGSKAIVTISGEVENYGSSYGDFIFLDFIARYGLLGALLLTFAICYTKKSARTSLCLLVLGSFHYGVIFSTPGQVIGACLIVLGTKAGFPRFKLKIHDDNKRFSCGKRI